MSLGATLWPLKPLPHFPQSSAPYPGQRMFHLPSDSGLLGTIACMLSEHSQTALFQVLITSAGSVVPAFFPFSLSFLSSSLFLFFSAPLLSLSLSKFLCDYKHCMVISAKLICTTTVNWLQQLINVLEIWHQNKKKSFFFIKQKTEVKEERWTDGKANWAPLDTSHSPPPIKSKNITLLFSN